MRLQRDKSRPPKCLNDLVWMPKYSQMMSKSIILDVLKGLLDDHVRMSQIHPKIIKKQKNDKNIFINDLYGLPRLISGGKNSRDWHSDWPHDHGLMVMKMQMKILDVLKNHFQMY